ncbi:MAG: S24/S26 family peptidase, partial [Bacteroidales bacterium]|nr:S24/S26 family peptidase [Bacteroidales bacterium]
LRKKEDVEAGDIVLAHLGGGRYVLHRVITVEGERLTLMGDGNIRGTESCLKSDVSGTVVRVLRPSGKESVPGKGRFWRAIKPLRRYILGIYRRIIKLFGK